MSLIISSIKNKQESGVSSGVSFRESTLGLLYRVLGIFTHCYGATLTILFFTRVEYLWPALVRFLEALQEPYLAGLGVYVVLKEIRKYRTGGKKGRRHGEYFVLLWVVLLGISTLAVIFSPQYHLDVIYRLILANGLATLVIFIGGLIHRP